MDYLKVIATIALKKRRKEVENNSYNFLKVRDDHELFKFFKVEDKFISNVEKSEWCNVKEITKTDLRARIEPWLTSLFQSEHLSLFVGSGLSTAVQYLAGVDADNGMNEKLKLSAFNDEVENAAKDSAVSSGRGTPNIEDRIRILTNLISGLRIIENSPDYTELKDKTDSLEEGFENIISNFAQNIAKIESSILKATPEKREEAFNSLTLFLMSFASRTGTRDRLNIFTTNYDRVIEAGADVAGLRLLDRFVGALSPIFRSSRMDIDMHYNPPGMRGEPRYLEGVVKYTKLHGSIDWVNYDNEIRRIGIPFGSEDLSRYLAFFGLQHSNLMIYPNSSKDKETTEYPYAELFRDFAGALCRPNSTLVTYGYSFGDDHINRIIRDMLTIPSTHLVIISYDDESGRINKLYNFWGRQSQISLLIGKDLADLSELVKYYLPKPAIDRSSIRMADILKQRFTQTSEIWKEEAQKDDTNS